MLTASSTYAQVVESGGEVELGDVLTLDLDVTGYSNDFSFTLQSFDFDTQMTTDLPDGVRTEEGYTTTGGSFTLAGIVDVTDESRSAAWFFNPNDPTSPLFRAKVKGTLVTYDMGVRAEGSQPETLRKVTGRVSSYTLDHDNGTATFQFVDLAGDWSAAPDVPAVITSPPYNAGLTSEFVFDLVARSMPKSPKYTWPAQRPNVIFAAGMRGSIWSEVGTLASSGSGGTPPTFATGTFGTGLTNPENIAWQLAAEPSSTITVEFLRWAPTSGTSIISVAPSSGPNCVVLTRSGADLTVALGTQAGPSHTFTGILNTTGPSHYLLVNANITTGVVTVTVDATVYTATITGTVPSGTPQPFPIFGILSLFGVIEGVQVTNESAPASNYGFTPSAFLDPSLNPLQVPPAIAQGADVWTDVIQKMASAELGYAYFDGSGNFRFKNRETLRYAASQRTVKSAASLLTGLQTVIGDFSSYDRVDVDYSDYHFRSVRTVFSPSVAWRVDAHNKANPNVWKRPASAGVFANLVTTAQPLTVDGAVNPDGTLGKFGGVDYSQGSYYRASNDRYGNGEHGYNSLTITASQIAPDHIAVTALNSSGSAAWLVSPSHYTDQAPGDPALWIAGQPVTTDNPTTVTSRYGDATPAFSDTGNEYRQDADAAQTVADWLLEDLHAARPDYQNVAIVPDARLEVGDRITLVDPDRSQINATCVIWGLSFSKSYSGGSASVSMSLNVRADAPPGAWLLGVPGASELGDGAGNLGTAYLY